MSTPYDVLIAIKKALKDSGNFQYVGYYPEDTKKAIAQAQNTSTDYAACIIEDGDEIESSELILNGYDNIDFQVSIYFFITQNKGLIIKKLHDIQEIIRSIMTNRDNFSDISGQFCIRFNGIEKGTKTDNIDENNMIGYSEGLTGRKINYTINMQIARNGVC